MSNKRRKSRGSAKIARNLAIRLRRGAEKLGNTTAGRSKVYELEHLEASYKTRGEKLREDVERHTAAYWGETR